MEREKSEVQLGEMVITAEYSRIKAESILGEELQLEFEPVIKEEPPEDVNPEVEQKYETGTTVCEKETTEYFNEENKTKSCSEKSEYSSSDDETVANLARNWRREENKIEMSLEIDKEHIVKGKYAMKKSAFKRRSKLLVDRFLSGPEGTLIPIKYKEIVLVKANQKGYSAPDGQLERFKKFVNEKELYCCEECDYTSEYLNIFNIHFLVHANIHFIQECIGMYPCYLCHFHCQDKAELAVHIETHRKKAPINVQKETHINSTIKVKKERHYKKSLIKVKKERPYKKSLIKVKKERPYKKSTIKVKKERHYKKSNMKAKKERHHKKSTIKVKNEIYNQPTINVKKESQHPVVKLELLDFTSTDMDWETPTESKVFEEDNICSDADGHYEDAKQYDPLPDEDMYDADDKNVYVEDDKSLLNKNEPMQFVNLLAIKEEIKEEDSEIIYKDDEFYGDGDNSFDLPLANLDVAHKPPAVVESNSGRKAIVKKKPRAKVKSNLSGERKAKRIYKPRPFLKCDKCQYTTRYRKYINHHKCRTSYNCKFCHHTSSNHPEYIQHLKIHQTVSIGRLGKHYQCLVCCTLFSRRDMTKSHIHREHCDQEKKLCGQEVCVKGRMKYECNECGKKFTSKFSLANHLDQRHSSGRVYKCTICQLGFNSGYAMRNHKKKHSCLNCPFQSQSLEEVIKHRETHPAPVKKEKAMLCCELCQYQTTITRRFEIHTLKHTNTVKQVFHCSQCEFVSNQKGNLAIHEKSHIVTDGYTCTICNFKCYRIETFTKHKLSHGLDESTLMMVDPSKRDERFHYCDKCEYKTKYPQFIKTHMLKHDNIRPYLCSDCGASFSCIMVFHSHKKSHTAVKKMYKCSYCNYKYHLKSTVQIHERKHTGVKPHVCDVCNYSTSYAGNLFQHRKKHFVNKLAPGYIKPPAPSLE